jgi:hypothetical protein
MSDLAQYNHNKLTTDSPCIAPGAWVNHIEDGQSWGMVVASDGDQASVLWSRAPKFVPDNFPMPSSIPPAQPHRARAWEHTDDEVDRIGRMYDAGMISKSFVRQYFELEEDYNMYDLSPAQIEDFKQNGEIIFHANDDGKITVKRKVDQLPPYINPLDVRRSRRF